MSYEPEESGTLAFDYLFNYFGGDSFKGKIINGASVKVAIHVYKNGEELKFTDEPRVDNVFLCDTYKVSFDREHLYKIEKNIQADNLLRIVFGWDKIKYEVIDYSFDYESTWREEELKDMPEAFKNLPVADVMLVTEDEWRDFVSSHLDDFDIRDNINAQIPSMSYL